MGRKRRLEFLLQSDQNRVGPLILPWLAIAGAFGLTRLAFLYGGPAWLAAAGCWGLAWWLGRKFRLGMLLTEHAFWDFVYLRPPRRYRWDEVEAVDEQGNQAAIRTRRGTVQVDDNLRSWRRLVARCREALGEPVVEEQPGPEVPPERVEEWLGVEPGGAVRYRLWRTGFLGIVVPALVLLEAIAGWNMGGWSTAATMAGMVVGVLAVTLWCMGELTPMQVDARGDGLYLRSLRGTRRLGWNTIRSVRKWMFWRFACTTEGDFQFAANSRAGRRLETALRQAIAARDEGFALPRMTDVSDAALSPVHPDEQLVSRGLSSVSGEEKDP